MRMPLVVHAEAEMLPDEAIWAGVSFLIEPFPARM